LVPALFRNFIKQRLPEKLLILGFARRPFSENDFRTGLYTAAASHAAAGIDDGAWDAFAQKLTYLQGDLDDAAAYQALEQRLRNWEGEGGGERLYYLATAPDYYMPAVRHLASAGMISQEHGRRALVVEKPYGHDLASAEELDEFVLEHFSERQIFRIDHYLGKETAQNIVFFRFANTIFEPVWNRRYVDNVQITVSETVDVGARAGYYDKSGALRDMMQNHLLQLLALVAMEPPTSLAPQALRNERVKLLSAIRPIDKDDVVLGQYEDYRSAAGVTSGSQTPTFAAVRLFIDTWRWQGVPFYLRTGKALAAKTSEISIQFQPPPDIMFDLAADAAFTPNRLSICVQPDEGIQLTFETKVPDSVDDSRSVDMEFRYQDAFAGGDLPDAYERLLLDALYGDASLFARSDGIRASWRLIDPLLHENDKSGSLVNSYPRGSWGPTEAHELLARAHHEWALRCGGQT
jgi:glucose-6-phosphate 1-dehydrogenase